MPVSFGRRATLVNWAAALWRSSYDIVISPGGCSGWLSSFVRSLEAAGTLCIRISLVFRSWFVSSDNVELKHGFACGRLQSLDHHGLYRYGSLEAEEKRKDIRSVAL